MPTFLLGKKFPSVKKLSFSLYVHQNEQIAIICTPSEVVRGEGTGVENFPHKTSEEHNHYGITADYRGVAKNVIKRTRRGEGGID